MDPRLCSSCRLVFEDPRHSDIRDPSRPAHQRHDYFAAGVHHASAKSFRDAVESKCPICVSILLACAPESRLPLPPNAGGPGEADCTTYRIAYGCGNPSQTPKLLPKLWVHFYFGGRSLYLVTLHHEDTNTLAPAVKVNELGLVKAWVDECVSAHKTCNPPAGTQLRYPTRLIQVNTKSDTEVQLVETTTTNSNTIRGPYNVVSYRWGSFQPVKLLQSNIAQLRKGIALNSLPRTLADAVEVTRAMGVAYLWIDALCIIQDSVEDWGIEARRMADVYGNAHCSLAASHNVDSNGGLSPRIAGGCRGRPVSVRFPTTSDWDLPYCDLELVEHNFWNNRVEDAPLNTRGWVVQERILAPRTIHFTFDQPVLECREKRFSRTRIDLDFDISHRRVVLPVPSAVDRDPVAFAKYWDRVVSYYTNRQLTFPNDRPVAIAGIARALQHARGRETKYIAGMWSRGLRRWLLWQAVDAEYPVAYRGPSWSWLAVNGRIFYDSDAIQGFRYLRVASHAKIESWRIITTDGTAFGDITAAVLELKALLCPVNILEDRSEFVASLRQEPGASHRTPLESWILESELSWSWDVSAEDVVKRKKSHDVSVVPIMEVTPTKMSNEACLYALIIERVDMHGQSSVYRRIGVLAVFGATRKAEKGEERKCGNQETLWLV